MRRRPLPLLLVLLPALLSAGGCGDGGGGGGADADPTAPDASDPTAPDGGSEPDPQATIPACYLSCATPADCAQPGPLFGADNYACDAGVCRWTGCNNTTECTQTYQSSDYVCAAPGGSPLPSCYRSCVVPADCDLGTALHDADNYACDGGACVFTGCNTTAECTETFQSAGYVCAVREPLAIPSCYPTCVTAADCDLGTPLYGADNYACDGGACVWTGCNATAECTATLMNPDYVCR